METTSEIQLKVISSNQENQILSEPIKLNKQKPRKLLPLFFITLIVLATHFYYKSFFLIEGGSILSISVLLYAEYASQKPKSPNFSYGFQRAQPLGTLFCYLIILLVSFSEIYFEFYLTIPADSLYSTLFTSLLEILQILIFKPDKMITLQLTWSILSHIFRLFAEIRLLAAGVLTVTVVISAHLLVIDAISQMMETTEGINTEDLIAKIYQIDGILDVHDAHFWKIGDLNYASIHILCEGRNPLHECRALFTTNKIKATIQLELSSFHCKNFKFHG